MGEAFRLGGWGMYPTTIAGLVLVYWSLRYAITPDAVRALVVRRLSLLTFLVGCLGFVAGVIKTFVNASTAEASELGSLVVTGIGESLNNVGLALSMLVVSGLAMTVGTARRGSAGTAELTDPHVR